MNLSLHQPHKKPRQRARYKKTDDHAFFEHDPAKNEAAVTHEQAFPASRHVAVASDCLKKRSRECVLVIRKLNCGIAMHQ